MFIFLERDGFEANSRSSGASARGVQKDLGDEVPIRRPYRGIQIKDDTYAVLSVRKPDGTTIPLASSSAMGWEEDAEHPGLGRVGEYSDFILQQVQDQRMEKQQIIETFGDSFVYFFGERPRIVTFSGVLMNTDDFNWRAQFWHNYENYLRGSRLVQLNARCYLAYDTIVIEGYPLSAQAVDSSEDPYSVPFSMTMLMTDYHEYSIIGEKRFPGVEEKDFEVLNKELDETRKKFVSTSLEVRRANFDAKFRSQLPGTNSALALLRSGVQAWNSAATFLGDKLDIANRLFGGRALRIPIGAASFLSMANDGELASASVVGLSGETKLVVNGVPIPGNKLRIMQPSKFSPSWVSAVTGKSRGMIYENYDEYPTRQAPSLSELLTKLQHQGFISKQASQKLKMTAFQQALTQFNVMSAAGGVLGTIADVVTAVREGYGMLLTAANFVANPLGVASAAIGTTPADVKRIGEGLVGGSFIPGVNMFVGQASRRTWENWLDRVEGAKIGDVFNAFEYQPRSDFARSAEAQKKIEEGAKEYEAAYGNQDYSSLITSQESVDAATLQAQGDLPADVDRAEPNAGRIAQSLDEVYGNTDSADFGEDRDDPATLDEVYGQSGAIRRTQPSAEERAALLASVYGTETPVSDTDTSGIRSEDAEDAPIDPVV